MYTWKECVSQNCTDPDHQYGCYKCSYQTPSVYKYVYTSIKYVFDMLLLLFPPLRLHKVIKDISKYLVSQDSGPWPTAKVSALDRALGEIGRILERKVGTRTYIHGHTFRHTYYVASEFLEFSFFKCCVIQ